MRWKLLMLRAFRQELSLVSSCTLKQGFVHLSMGNEGEYTTCDVWYYFCHQWFSKKANNFCIFPKCQTVAWISNCRINSRHLNWSYHPNFYFYEILWHRQLTPHTESCRGGSGFKASLNSSAFESYTHLKCQRYQGLAQTTAHIIFQWLHPSHISWMLPNFSPSDIKNI